MSTDLVQLGSRTIELHTPPGLAASTVVPLIRHTVSVLAQSFAEVRKVIVEYDHQRRAHAYYYNQYSKVLREDILPLLAAANAHNSARRMAENLGLDSDIEDDLLSDLEAKRQARRRSY